MCGSSLSTSHADTHRPAVPDTVKKDDKTSNSLSSNLCTLLCIGVTVLPEDTSLEEGVTEDGQIRPDNPEDGDGHSSIPKMTIPRISDSEYLSTDKIQVNLLGDTPTITRLRQRYRFGPFKILQYNKHGSGGNQSHET